MAKNLTLPDPQGYPAAGPQGKMRPNIILTGFMGSGKTTVGRLLARQLHYSFVDTDQLIEARAGISVQEIFKTQGEAAFRRLEAETAAALSAEQGLVIATGGGLMLNPDNARALEGSGSIFCLAARPEEILQRVSRGARVRPLLDSPDPLARICDLIREREKSYGRFPQIPTSGKTPREVMEEILARLPGR